jgi:hypothetical protein
MPLASPQDSLSDVCKTPSLVRMVERCAFPPPSVSSMFFCFSFTFVTSGPDNYFAGAAQPPPLLNLPLENLDEDLECCLHHVSFVLPSYFHAIVLILIDCSMSKKQRAQRAAESA